MAKIIKLNVYEKTVYAVQVEENLYIDELGVKHLSPSPENCKNTRNVPPALRTALEHLAKNHTARKKVEDKRTKFLKEISQQLNELEKDECAIMKELRDAKGIISRDEFVDAFFEALPDRVKDAMKQYGYSAGSTPYNLGYDDNHIYIIRNVIVYKYNKNIPYAYEEYDGNWMMCDEAEEMEAYKKDIKKNEKLLPVSMPINSYMWTGDKFSTWYSGVYEIAIEDDMTKEYAKELAKKAKGNGMNEAEYIRLLISQKPNDYPEVRKLLKELINEINRIGININQIVFNNNAGLYSKDDKTQLIAYMRKLNQKVDEAVSQIGNQ